MNSRKCDICNVDVHRASYVKQLGNRKQLENIKQNEMFIPERLFKEPIESKIIQIYNPKSLKPIARDNIRLHDEHLNKEVAKKMPNPCYFTDKNLKEGFKINLDSHHITHAKSKIFITPNCPEFGIDVRYNNKIVKDLSVIYARLINQYKFIYQTVFSARFNKQDEDNQVLD